MRDRRGADAAAEGERPLQQLSQEAATGLPSGCGAGTVLGRPSWLPVPDFALQTLLGEGAGVVLDGQRVLPARAQVPPLPLTPLSLPPPSWVRH